MKKVLISTIILLSTASTGYCTSSQFFPPLLPQGVQNQSLQNSLTDANSDVGFVAPVKGSNTNLAIIEKSLFGRVYGYQNINSRLSRIEKALFFTTYPNASSSQRIDNIISNFNQINKNPNISKNSLSKLEQKVFNQQFTQNSAQRRIERLEQQIFGAEQSGELDARLKALQIAAKSYNSNNSNNEDDFGGYTSYGQNSGWKNMLGNFTTGTMTGFTPNINPYNSYNYGGYNSSVGRYNPYRYFNRCIGGQGVNQGVRTNYGYSNGFRTYGSGAGVTILD